MQTSRRTRKAAAVLAAAVIAPTALAGVGVAGAQSSTISDTSTSTAPDRGPRGGGPT